MDIQFENYEAVITIRQLERLIDNIAEESHPKIEYSASDHKFIDEKTDLHLGIYICSYDLDEKGLYYLLIKSSGPRRDSRPFPSEGCVNRISYTG